MINPRPPLAQCLAVALCLPLLASCTGLDRNDQGVLQPQTVSGPCTVGKFYLLALTAVHTDMQAAAGEACTFSILNPALNAVPTAALVTARPAHGTATAALTGGGQVVASYTAAPGYSGTDAFTITIEPNDHAVAVRVRVGG